LIKWKYPKYVLDHNQLIPVFLCELEVSVTASSCKIRNTFTCIGEENKLVSALFG
jgi:hypothetical protein